ncbi:MAG: NAD(P)/FAD-dependent oxidoreductase [Burkholderiales bacterium]|nr:NAD(P)/FAD-dependent oxidoreductase [Burkholderiales bacterium]
MADFDAIVIGSGHNGLACALYLADAGWRVLVLERAAQVGGAVRTSEVLLPGYRSDLYATNFGAFLASPLYRDFQDALDAAGLEFLSNRCSSASVYPGGRATRIYADSQATEVELASSAPRDLHAWRELLRLHQRTAPKILPLHYCALPSAAMLGHLARLCSSPADALRVGRILTQSVRNFLNAHLRSEQLKGALAPWSMHFDLGPDASAGAVYPFMMGIGAAVRPIPIVKGGAARLPETMRSLIDARGGQVRTSAEATRVIVRGARAVGVELASGEILDARRAVVANVTPRRLFGQLVSADYLPIGFLRRMRAFEYGLGTFVLHLALARPLEWRAAPDLAQFNTVHIGGALEDLRQAHAEALTGLLPRRPLLIVGQPTCLDRTRAPDGRHIARIHVRGVPPTIAGDAAGVIAERTWDAAKERFADRLLALLESHAPNAREALVARHAMSPVDLERENPNFVGGDCCSGSHRLGQNYLLRPIPGWSRYATPIHCLYMVGASTWAGASLNGTSGHQVARKLLGMD